MIDVTKIKGNIYLYLLKRFVRNFFVSLDQFLNVLLLGDEDETISSRLGKSQRGDYGTKAKATLFPLAKAVDFVALKVFKDPDHCLTSIEEGIGGNSMLSILEVYKAYQETLKKKA